MFFLPKMAKKEDFCAKNTITCDSECALMVDAVVDKT